MTRLVVSIWISLSSVVLFSVQAQTQSAVAHHQLPDIADLRSAALDQDQSLYAVINDGLPVRWSTAKAHLAGLEGPQDILLLRMTPKGFEPLGWQQWRSMTPGEGSTASSDDLVPLLSIDRRVPHVAFVWQGRTVERNGRSHVRPDSELMLRFDDDSGLASFKAYLNQTESEPPDLWPLGEQQLIIYATDRAGNAGRAGETQFLVDGTPPEIRCEAVDAGTAGVQVYQLPITLRCSSSDDSGVDEFLMRSEDSWAGVPVGAFELQQADLTLMARDGLGQTRQRTLSWPIDDQPPTVRIDLPDGGRMDGEDIFLDPGDRIAVTISDAGIGVMEARYRYNDRDWADIPETIRFVDRGWYVLDIEATDHFGQTTTQFWYVRTGSPRSQRPRRS